MEFTRKRAVAPILTLLSLSLLAGCGGNNNNASASNGHPTNGIYPYMRAIQDESGNVTTIAQLRDGATSSADYLYLSDGDGLFSALDTSPQQYLDFSGNLFSNSLELSQHVKAMSSRDTSVDYGIFTGVSYGTVEYFAVETPSASSSPTLAYIDFKRSGNAVSAESSVELPPAFQILTPASDAIISRSTPLTVSWTGLDPSTTIEIDVAGICADNSRFTDHLNLSTDRGLYILQATNYFPSWASPSLSCRVAFGIQRVRLGSASPQFALGIFKGIQQRTVQFTSTQ